MKRSQSHQRAVRWLFSLMCLMAAGPALAHGERNQEPFLRMRTAHFYDVKWSTDHIAVNEEVTVSGRFRLFEDWPANLPKPERVFIGNGTPGPVLARVESYINGSPAIQSGPLQLDRDYEFKTVLKGRIPGRHHVHPMVNVEGAGPLLGPGSWVEVSGDHADFKLPLTTLDGTQIPNLETWGVDMVVRWQGFWILLALVFAGWWLRRPLLMTRLRALEAGREDLLVTRGDRLWAAVFLTGTVLTVFGAATWAENRYPRTVPLQAGQFRVDPLPRDAQEITVKVERATYDVPGRSMKMTLTLHNPLSRPVQLGEFLTANLRFVNHAVPAAMALVDPGYPTDIVPRAGLTVHDTAPLAPGETRSIKIEATDAAWESERLTSLLTDPDNRVGGLLFLFDDAGERHIANVSGAIMPVFTGG
jgi:methane/ammonia monooxygenase subunit B